MPESAGTPGRPKSRCVDWRAIREHSLPQIVGMRCQNVGATVCFVSRRSGRRRKTQARSRDGLASIIRRHKITKLRCRLNTPQRVSHSELRVVLARNRRRGRQQVTLGTALGSDRRQVLSSLLVSPVLALSGQLPGTRYDRNM